MRIGLLGIQRSASPDDWTLKRHDPLTAFVMAVKECYFVISRSLGYLYDVITGREAADQLGGPIRIAQVSGQVATAGFFALLNLAAIISVSIGLINLFPIPMLDGGHLLFYGIEAVRGKQQAERALRDRLALDRMATDEHLADQPADRSITGLARGMCALADRIEVLGDAPHLRRCSGTVETFDDDQPTAHARRLTMAVPNAPSAMITAITAAYSIHTGR